MRSRPSARDTKQKNKENLYQNKKDMRSRPSTRDTSLEGYHNPVGEDQNTQPN